MNMRLLPLMILALALTACASKIVKQEDLNRVHRVAIIGLDVQQQKSISKADLVSIALKQNNSQATPRERTESAHIEGIYQSVATKIAANTGWKVIALNDVRKSPAYQKYFKEKTEGFQNRPIINGRFNLYEAPGVLDSFAVMTTKAERLAALAREMNVDAFIYATSTVNLNNSSLMASMVGKGEFRPSSDFTLFVVDPPTGKKIFMNSAQGSKVETGERNIVGVANEDNLNQLAQSATGLSMDMVLKKLSVQR